MARKLKLSRSRMRSTYLRFSFQLTVLQWLQKSVTLILKGQVGLEQVCRMCWVSTRTVWQKNDWGWAVKQTVLSGDFHICLSRQRTSIFDIETGRHRRRCQWPACPGGFRGWDVKITLYPSLLYLPVYCTSHHLSLWWLSLTYHHHHLSAFQWAPVLSVLVHKTT